MKLIDTHAHLQFNQYNPDRALIIERAIQAGVTQIICPGSNLVDSAQGIELAKKFPQIIRAAVGIHPQQTDPEYTDSLENQLKKLEKLATQPEVVAIGECGLDYAPAPPGEKDRSPEEQEELFIGQIKIAQQNNLPLLVHTRQAFSQTVEILNRFKNLRGVFHCYSAGKKGIEAVNKLCFYFGLDGNLTYDEGLQKVAALIPLEKILFETDAPWLSPLPYRGQRNEPCFLTETAKKLAEIKKVSLENVAKTTTQNAEKLIFTPRKIFEVNFNRFGQPSKRK